ncbi:hypothetical protein SDJN02_23114, partial [Cucurbita argyrosperma subsp. argyrosperma]
DAKALPYMIKGTTEVNLWNARNTVVKPLIRALGEIAPPQPPIYQNSESILNSRRRYCKRNFYGTDFVFQSLKSCLL